MKGIYKSYGNAERANKHMRIVAVICDGKKRFAAASYSELRVEKWLESCSVGNVLYEVYKLRNGLFGNFATNTKSMTFELPIEIYSNKEDALDAHYAVVRRHQELNHFA